MITLKQHKFSDVKDMGFDAIIVSSGFEARASYQSKIIENLPAIKIAFCFDNETNDEIRKRNDDFFISKGFELVQINSDETNIAAFQTIIDRIIDNSVDTNVVDIYIDYSSMSRNWYAYILYIFSNLRVDKKVNLFFGYSYAEFVSSADTDILNKIVEPLFGFCHLSVPSKPTALVICLGNEKNRVYGLKEFFDAATYLFYSDSSFDNKYSDEVELVNFEIIKDSKADHIIRFPVHDLIYTNYLIENLCKVLLTDFRVVVAPCGPKPFTLLALINSVKFGSDIEVWRISPGVALPKINRDPNGLISVLQVSFDFN